jgi:uncharacterized membrane protein YqaE (UPF0057 family)
MSILIVSVSAATVLSFKAASIMHVQLLRRAGVAILALLLPPVAFYVHQGYISKHFWWVGSFSTSAAVSSSSHLHVTVWSTRPGGSCQSCSAFHLSPYHESPSPSALSVCRISLILCIIIWAPGARQAACCCQVMAHGAADPAGGQPLSSALTM